MKSWNEIRKAATAFSKRWKNAFDEKAQAQSFLKEFFAVFGVDAVTVAMFEHRVKFADGAQGYIDCFWQGNVLVEMKSRGKMGWPNYFSTAMARAGTVYNYYSTGDPIFLESDTVPGVTTGIFHWPTLSLSWPFIDFNITAEANCWQKQETHKGVEPIAGTLRGGWGFNCWYETVGGEPVQMYYTAAQANAMVANGSITNSPVFSYGGTPLNNRNASQDDIWLSLAKYVPAISSPLGGSEALDVDNNFDLNNVADIFRPNGWGRDHNVYRAAWLHSDMKDMAYFYVYKLYEQLVTRGDMQ